MRRLQPRSPWLIVGWIAFLSMWVAYHTISDYLTARDVAHNRGVIHLVCLGQNREVEAIRTMLIDGIKNARRGELVIPQFHKQLEQQIRQSQGYLARVFVIRKC